MKTSRKLRPHALAILGLLVVQYALGMLSNFYVSFPDGENEWQHWHFAESQLLLVAHIVVGMLLMLGLLALLIRAFRAKDRQWKISSGIAFGSVVLAIMSGSEFITTQADLYSLAMSFFFIFAVLALFWGIYKSKN